MEKDKQLKSKGLFLSFEGIEGSGKSTQIQILKQKLEEHGHQVHILREPGGTAFGEKLREAILQSDTALHPLAEAHLFASSRAQLLHQTVIPTLSRPKQVVILDRFVDSSVAYQGFARGLGADKIEQIHNIWPLSLRPDMTFYLKIDLETSMARQTQRGQEKDYFEKEKKEFYTQLIQGYNYCAKENSSRVVTIDGRQEQNSVSQQILESLSSLLEEVLSDS